MDAKIVQEYLQIPQEQQQLQPMNISSEIKKYFKITN